MHHSHLVTFRYTACYFAYQVRRLLTRFFHASERTVYKELQGSTSNDKEQKDNKVLSNVLNTWSQSQLKINYLALIIMNRSRGLYIVCMSISISRDRTQWSLYTRMRSRFSQTDQLSIWQKQQQVNSFTFVLTDTLIANGDGPNLILRTFARPLYCFLFFSSALWHLQK